jgi:dolichyl-phosphate-mannose--protein O-mannosyl transferase
MTPVAAAREPLRRATLVVLAPFAVLLALHAAEPSRLVFDEVHYVPAADMLARLAGDLNWEHPPLSKWIMGLGARGLCASGIACAPAADRLVASVFGLWVLATVVGLLVNLGLPPWAAACATAMTGANVLWFVQSRTAMPDIFAVAFALAGLRRTMRPSGGSPWIGWVLLGLGMACKWSAAPMCVLAVAWSPFSARVRAVGVVLALFAYALPFLPLALLHHDATPISEILRYQLRMLDGHRQIDLSRHPYASTVLQWPTLLRPIWYHYEHGAAGDRYVWAGGNPLVHALSLPATVWLAVRGFGRDPPTRERRLALLYWVPLAFSAALSRPQLYYYYLASSLWLGPAVVWLVLDLFARRSRGAGMAVVVGLTAASLLLFFWFLPILTGQLEPAGTYQRYMWLRTWR